MRSRRASSRVGWRAQAGDRRRTPSPFRRLAEAQVLHAAGDGMVAVALANTLFFAVPIGEARDKVGLYLALTMAPFAVLSPLVGPWLDRRSGTYRLAIILGAGGRAVLAVLLATGLDLQRNRNAR